MWLLIRKTLFGKWKDKNGIILEFDNLRGQIYKNKYFANALVSFMNNILSDSDKYMEFKREIKRDPNSTAGMYFNYLNTGWRREYLQNMSDAMMINNPGSVNKGLKNLQRLFNL